MVGPATAIVLGVLSSFLLIFLRLFLMEYTLIHNGALLTGYIVGETCVDGVKMEY